VLSHSLPFLLHPSLLTLLDNLQAFAAGFAVLVGLTILLLILGVSGAIFLWFYGSFWTTTFAIILAGDGSSTLN